MDANRRTVLLGLGTAAAGSGVVFGSGAFTQLEAERDVNIEVVGQADGLLGIDVDDGSEFVDVEEENETAFDFTIDDDGQSLDVNLADREELEIEDFLDLTANVRNATTDDALEVEVSIEDDGDEDVSDVVDLVEGTDNSLTDDSPFTIGDGVTVENISLVIDGDENDIDEVADTITFDVEETDDGSPDFE